jgi:hypothetical protein
MRPGSMAARDSGRAGEPLLSRYDPVYCSISENKILFPGEFPFFAPHVPFLFLERGLSPT